MAHPPRTDDIEHCKCDSDHVVSRESGSLLTWLLRGGSDVRVDELTPGDAQRQP